LSGTWFAYPSDGARGGSDAYVAIKASSRDVGVDPTGKFYFAG